MDFMEAVSEMKKGKKVKLADWVDGLYIRFGGLNCKTVVDTSNEEYTLYPYCFDADWELFEETKTLSDKIIKGCPKDPNTIVVCYNDCVDVKDIREFINNIRNEFQELRDDASAVGMEKQLADVLIRLEARLDKQAGERFK